METLLDLLLPDIPGLHLDEVLADTHCIRLFMRHEILKPSVRVVGSRPAAFTVAMSAK
jgi:hypothetical protein